MMPRAAGTSQRSPAVLPPGLVAAMGRGLRRFAGALLLALAVALAVALVGWSPTDPSLNLATGAAPQNPLGLPGAMTADLLLQMFGAATLLLPLVFGVWGIRLLAGRPVRRFALRLAALPLVVIFAALALAAAPTPAIWPLPVGSGGFAGGLMLDGSLHLLTLVGAGGTGVTIPSALGGLLALTLLLPLLAMAPAEWLALGRGAWRLPWRGLPGLARAARHGLAGPVAGLRRRARARVEPVLGAVPAPGGEPGSGDDPVAVLPESADPAPAGPPPPKFLVEPRSDGDGAAPKPARGRQRSLDLGRNGGYRLPGVELLEPTPAGDGDQADSGSLAQNARLLESVLADFGVSGEVVKVRPGPVVTLYEFVPAPGTKSSRVIGLSDDLARSLSAVSVRVAVIPGRNVIGIELPNARRETVFLREILESRAYERAAARLPLVLGKDIGGGPVIADLARMPHLLIAGTTGSGKSVSINTLVLSLLYRLRPEECRFIMIDPKMLELSVYDGIPHLLAPVVTEPARAVVALKWVVREMEGRYQAIARLGVRNIEGYNNRIAEAARRGEVLRRRVQTGFDNETGRPVYEEQPLDLEPLPWIVVIVDEMADLMLVAGKDIEAAVQRLAQMARAAGIHLIMATQRPSVDVITGTIKANFPTRISFQVTSRIDSRTILGEQGAETLLGQGDMLYMAGGGRITRVHGPFVGDSEVEDIVRHLKSQGSPAYIEAITDDDDSGATMLAGDVDGDDDGDGLYRQAVELVVREGKASTSFVQRHLQIGYNRAARLIDRMEAEGIISQANHVGKREILLGRDG